LIVDIADQTNELSAESISLIERLIHFLAKEESIPDRAEVSVNFVDAKTIQSLNLQYRNIDEPTDVISFAMQELSDEEMMIQTDESLPLTLGDIIISVDQAKEQATTYNHSLTRELGFLTVHGFLHLLGYNHLTKETEQEMFTKQEHLLQAFGLERS